MNSSQSDHPIKQLKEDSGPMQTSYKTDTQEILAEIMTLEYTYVGPYFHPMRSRTLCSPLTVKLTNNRRPHQRPGDRCPPNDKGVFPLLVPKTALRVCAHPESMQHPSVSYLAFAFPTRQEVKYHYPI